MKGEEDLEAYRESTFSDSSGSIKAVPAARWRARREGVDLSLVKGSGPDGTILLKDIQDFRITKTSIETVTQAKKIHASSLARKLAEKKGISFQSIEGSGTRGRIMMGDVIKAGEMHTVPLKEKGIFGQTIPMSRMRKVIAKRMVQSAFTAPHIYFFTNVKMDELIQLHDNILTRFEKQFKARISMNDFFIKAVALTIKEFPMLNATVKGEEIYIMPEINIGLAVATEGGLIVPAIPQADQLGLEKISKMRSDLVERARSGKLKLEEIERGTFTISSLAQFDVTFFTAILNPPQSGILTVGKTSDQLFLEKGEVVAQKLASFGLSVDHRIVDGAIAAAFLQSLKNKLENPTFAFIHI
jgi:pyruvate dehydrogenase E2 component (dihydrolipoamide acetyltransferase)